MIVAAILFAWLQYVGGGPHARAIVTGACPIATFDGRPARMTQRAAEGAGFGDTVCDVRVPAQSKSVKLGVRPVPAPAHALRTIVVFGDTGCRILGPAVQACNDPVQWPFPVVAQSIAKVHPDLIVHVGDYFYRETPCPPLVGGCAGSPSGDKAASWYADWFTPGTPLFSVAPLVLARGNHEDCTRGSLGWTRYLEPSTAGRCQPMDAPFVAAFKGLRIVVFDSAIANDDRTIAANAAPLKQNFDAARALVSGPTWFVTHRPPYLNADENAAMGNDLDAFSAVIVGHIHLFAVMNNAPHAPMVINGIGGDNLDAASGAKLRSSLGPDGQSVSVNFGFAVYTRTAAGWDISLRNPNGAERARCVLTEGKPGTVRC
ncbi:MAG TPA: metallophosphoesterase [Candidatus Binatia bacterium]|nr:metallophosphoesterase [Candidatus Binatia bacterium]